MVKFTYCRSILRYCFLGILGLCLVILSALFSGIFPYYGNTRTIFLILSASLAVSFTVIFIVDLTRNTLGREKTLFMILFSIIVFVSVVEYYFLVDKQDDLITTAISTLERSVESYELLSELPNSEVITILEDSRIPKKLCAVSYFIGVFYLCVKQTDRAVVFMIDIASASNAKKTIRVSTRERYP